MMIASSNTVHICRGAEWILKPWLAKMGGGYVFVLSLFPSICQNFGCNYQTIGRLTL